MNAKAIALVITFGLLTVTTAECAANSGGISAWDGRYEVHISGAMSAPGAGGGTWNHDESAFMDITGGLVTMGALRGSISKDGAFTMEKKWNEGVTTVTGTIDSNGKVAGFSKFSTLQGSLVIKGRRISSPNTSSDGQDQGRGKNSKTGDSPYYGGTPKTPTLAPGNIWAGSEEWRERAIIRARQIEEEQKQALERKKKSLDTGSAGPQLKNVFADDAAWNSPTKGAGDSYANDPNVVDLSGSKSLTPQLLRGPSEEGDGITAPGSPIGMASSEYEQLRQMSQQPRQVSDKKFSELQPGDVLLIGLESGIGSSSTINLIDNLLSGDKESDSSHTVLYLQEVNGVKHFLENVPFKGPHIIFEGEFLHEYASRGAEVATLVEPLKKEEVALLYREAVQMSAANRKSIDNTFPNKTMDNDLLKYFFPDFSKKRPFGTDFGTWGEDDIVCSEADWRALRAAGRDIPKSDDATKVILGVDYSPADYKNDQYFNHAALNIDVPQTNR